MKIPCGGFQLNDNDFKFNDNGELSLQQSGGSGDAGYTVSEMVIVPEQTVVVESSPADIVVADGAYDFLSVNNTCVVKINDTEYNCGVEYGNDEFSIFVDSIDAAIYISEEGSFFSISTDGTYTISVSSKAYDISDDFKYVISLGDSVKYFVVDNTFDVGVYNEIHNTKKPVYIIMDGTTVLPCVSTTFNSMTFQNIIVSATDPAFLSMMALTLHSDGTITDVYKSFALTENTNNG